MITEHVKMGDYGDYFNELNDLHTKTQNTPEKKDALAKSHLIILCQLPLFRWKKQKTRECQTYSSISMGVCHVV